ncbi:MAG: toll/interleukin-1 receptor domain-containing protein [Deltaproteobacteria bacterium]|nr:toll/interleukin-1 receptor domain-containing protein [Deltaproteobacteria bacterium]
MGSHVFICYAHEDRDFVLTLASQLKARDVVVWSGVNGSTQIEVASD